MRAIVLALGFLVLGYFIGAGMGMGLVMLLSGNTHDRDLEALYTGFFFAGPILALIAAALGLVLGLRRRPS
jgi:hypothetical protein